MTVQTDLYTALASTFSSRFYPQVAPNVVTVPYGVYSVISQVPANVLDGTPGLFNSRLQVDIFSNTYSEAQTLKASVRTAMASGFGDRATEALSQDLYEDAVKLHRVSMDWSVWHN